MKTIQFLTIIFLSGITSASAELWVKTDGDAIVSRYSGDCYKAGFCEPNNANLSDGWHEVKSDQYELAGRKYSKFSGGEVVEMNVIEKAATDILEAQAEQESRDAEHNAIVEQAKAEFDAPTTVAALLNTCISAITTDEIREIKKGTPTASKTDSQLKATVKACLDTFKK